MLQQGVAVTVVKKAGAPLRAMRSVVWQWLLYSRKVKLGAMPAVVTMYAS